MAIITLDNAAISELEKITWEDLAGTEAARHENRAYVHHILDYGIRALAHVHLMRMAKAIQEGTITLDEFIGKYNLDFEAAKSLNPAQGHISSGFTAPLSLMEADGIFIPKHAYMGEGKRIIPLFDGDYFNRMQRPSWTYDHIVSGLLMREWHPEELKDSRTTEEGELFGKAIWNTCEVGFDVRRDRQDLELNIPAQKYVKYLNSIINPQPKA